MNQVPHKIFYSWQNDQPKSVCRNFIEQSLNKAIAQVIRDASVEPAKRPEMGIDKDTEGVAGSPPIVETIFAKIDLALAYVADLTFVGTRADGRPTPNPNVLIEYGWALKSLGHSRLIGVMNTAYGQPSEKNLPFNMRHLRWPIQYKLPETATDREKAQARDELVKILAVAIKAILDDAQPDADAVTAESPPFPAAIPKDGRARFRAKSESLGITDNEFGDRTTEVTLNEGPAVWLRVMPAFAQPRSWRIVELTSILVTQGKTFPPLGPWRSLSYLRGLDGIGTFAHIDTNPTNTSSVAYLFQSGEVWGVNTRLLENREQLPNVERTFTQFFNRAIAHLQRDLGVAGPYRWIAGIEDTKNRKFHPLASPGKEFYPSVWTCTKPEISGEGVHIASDPAHLALVPFFEEIFDACGLARPKELSDGLQNL